MGNKKIKESRSARITLGPAGGHREYRIGDMTYIVEGRYSKAKNDGTDKTFANRIEEFIGSEFAELTGTAEDAIIEADNTNGAA